MIPKFTIHQSWLLGVRTTADFTIASIVVVLELVNFDFKMWPNVISKYNHIVLLYCFLSFSGKIEWLPFRSWGDIKAKFCKKSWTIHYSLSLLSETGLRESLHTSCSKWYDNITFQWIYMIGYDSINSSCSLSNYLLHSSAEMINCTGCKLLALLLGLRKSNEDN